VAAEDVTSRMEPLTEQDVRFGDPDSPPTAWADTRSVIETAELFWVSTVRADGRPHVTPLPAVWDDDRLHFCTGPAEQKAVNLDRNPHVALTTGSNRWKEGLDVVVEGEAVQVTDDSRLRTLADLWREKYHGDWDFAVEGGMFREPHGGTAMVFEVAPTKVLAFAKGRFAQTRYRFARPSSTR
jgi:nitroimidazol reductase NimA-like FMN-containing flavoprotein (pyridoxamine 5'-phosphate oxidase superfamily)